MFQDIIITKALGLHGPFLSPNCPLPRSFSSTSRVTISFPLIFYFILPYQLGHIHRHTNSANILPGKISTKKSFEKPKLNIKASKFSVKEPKISTGSKKLAKTYLHDLHVFSSLHDCLYNCRCPPLSLRMVHSSPPRETSISI